MNKPTQPNKPKSTPPDIPPAIADRPDYKRLTPDAERAFVREQAEYEAAFRQTGDPLPLWEALRHVERSRQTVPHWLALAFFAVVMRAMTPDEARRARERERHARRYTCVRKLRRKGHTKDHALDQAEIILQREGDEVMRRGVRRGVSRDTIKDSHDLVSTDLKRRGRESEYYFFVDKEDEGG